MDVVFIDEYNQYATSFTDYLKENKGKFVAIISPNQYAIEINKDFSHEGMRSDLIRRTRPNMKMDNWGNAIDPNDDYKNDTIVLLGSPGEIWIEFPLREKLNTNQYNSLCNILNEINNFNQNNTGQKYMVNAYGFGIIEIEAKDYQDNIPKLINKLSGYVGESSHSNDEVIIGEKFKNVNIAANSVEEIIDKMEKNIVDTNGNPILGPDSEYRIKGYSNIVILILITTVVSAVIFLLGMFIDLN